MGRSYAGILGPLAFLTPWSGRDSRGVGENERCLKRRFVCSCSPRSDACWVRWPAWIVDDSVRARLAAEMAAATDGS